MLNMVTWPRNPWSVFDELESLHEGVNRALRRPAFGPGGQRGGTWQDRSAYPHMNVWSSPEGVVIDAELPGVNPEDVDISVMGDELSLRGKVNDGEKEGETYYRRERPSGEFSRTLQLPFRVESGKVKANYKNGVLRINLPRSEQEKPKRIAVDAS